MRQPFFGSRFFLAPINTGFAANGVVSEALVQFHALRSGRGIGVGYVGNVAVAPDARTNEGTAEIAATDLAVWKRLCQTISEAGTVPAIQLACRVGPHQSGRRWVAADREERIAELSAFVAGLSSEEMETLCDSFVSAGSIAISAGFRVVQVHAAHGYLLSLLLNRIVNRRRDRFGGDGLMALRLIVGRLRALSDDVVVDVRVSLRDGLEDSEVEMAYRTDQIDRLVGVGCDMISLSAGLYDIDRRMVYPGRREGPRVYLRQAEALASAYPSTFWNVAGNLGSIVDLAEHKCSNLTFGLARPLIADPAFVEKSLSGRESEIRSCAFTGHCHYFSRGRPHLECGVNPSVGRA